MDTEEFVKAFHTEKESQLKDYLSDNPDSAVGLLIKSLNLDKSQTAIMQNIINGTLTDTYYGILLGLEESGSIGGLVQQRYDVKDSKGNQLNDGDIGGFAYEYFQESE
ncbi:hypothetical protein M4I21_12360 [Cellulophaga sp. 20_2_10]|uniref:hypothetical protein n=1 Tax=Cellulophaga sp. 20_2_10 TaxID=2942476 RepID=UPI00201ACA04|nr:hypothetical protein [Cellulophaga sp. 20_2_10]MCL5246609.1 hypothetical protein [Cellulophaga sp. 20_2_10]